MLPLPDGALERHACVATATTRRLQEFELATFNSVYVALYLVNLAADPRQVRCIRYPVGLIHFLP